ncbi:Uncharacterised protein [Staphylococcus aureus]|nr:Uncharacterised protein [Staphylococcus aureus]
MDRIKPPIAIPTDWKNNASVPPTPKMSPSTTKPTYPTVDTIKIPIAFLNSGLSD